MERIRRTLSASKFTPCGGARRRGSPAANVTHGDRRDNASTTVSQRQRKFQRILHCVRLSDRIGSLSYGVEHLPGRGHLTRQSSCCHCANNEEVTPRQWENVDANQLHTQLRIAVEAEDFLMAGSLRDELQFRCLTDSDSGGSSWQELGLPDWLAERAEQYGFRFPTEVQARTTAAVLSKSDCIIQGETGSGKTLAFLLPALSRITPGQLGPQCVVLVPTRELGVQTALLVYKLWGGSVNPGLPGLAGNMFAYTGPRGMKVRGILDKEEVVLAKNHDILSRTDLLVATPDALAEVMTEPEAQPGVISHATCVIIDEVDACFQAHSEAMETILTAAAARKPRPVIVAVGATVQAGFSADAQQMGWMESPSNVVVGKAEIPSGIEHFMTVCQPERAIAVLCRQVRADLVRLGEDSPPPRVIVFTSDEAAAVAVGDALRKALWGAHRIAVLLPQGQEPIKALHAFRDNVASLLVATPSAARGLDLPEVSHVYNVGLPSDSTDYLHRAGRAGRIGGIARGVVVSLVPEVDKQALLDIAETLHFSMQQLPEPALDTSDDPDKLKQGLEDLFNLF